MTTLTEENYIKAIYHLGGNGAQQVSTNAIAEHLETKASSVTDMVKKLSEKGYASYVKYKGVVLTESGEKVAISTIRKHRLWEVFLVDYLKFNWDEVHEVAEQLEHIKSEKLVSELDAFLKFPTHDPHGDPIPNAKGEFKKISKILLAEANLKTAMVCVGVKDSSKPFLNYLDKNKISLGSKIEVLAKEEFDNSIEVVLDGVQLTISELVAQNLYVTLL